MTEFSYVKKNKEQILWINSVLRKGETKIRFLSGSSIVGQKRATVLSASIFSDFSKIIFNHFLTIDQFLYQIAAKQRCWQIWQQDVAWNQSEILQNRIFKV